MVFTPLLSSTCVGTLEPQCVAVHITDIQKALFKVGRQEDAEVAHVLIVQG